jgi:broad-specificity NMP kinase
VTGMSGTGKSSALERLRLLGFRAVDTDEGDWTQWSETEGGYVWREERIAELLACDKGPSLYVSGTVSNQGRFYERFDAVVLLSAPANVLLGRIETRSTNPYGRPQRSGSSCSATWPRWSHVYVGPALTRSMPRSRS